MSMEDDPRFVVCEMDTHRDTQFFFVSMSAGRRGNVGKYHNTGGEDCRRSIVEFRVGVRVRVRVRVRLRVRVRVRAGFGVS
jgi:hypothetical protein